jgi:hypothetical protein
MVPATLQHIGFQKGDGQPMEAIARRGERVTGFQQRKAPQGLQRADKVIPGQALNYR